MKLVLPGRSGNGKGADDGTAVGVFNKFKAEVRR
jgi:hypothetical protein